LGEFVVGKPIRGGLPVCFPWFGYHRTDAGLPPHGFVRMLAWEPVSSEQLPDGRIRLNLELRSSVASKRFWPCDFLLKLAVVIGVDLEVSLAATNTGSKSFEFEEGFHSYFQVGDVGQVGILGFSGANYRDALVEKGEGTFLGEIRPLAATDLVFPDAPRCSTIQDKAARRRILCEQDGFRDTVVWTPWDGAMANFPDIGTLWRDFICVEAVNFKGSMLTLGPGESHRGRVTYSIAEDRRGAS
jgi:D-hexose-6-phosphate mutarotase